jgi:hypothetical protein
MDLQKPTHEHAMIENIIAKSQLHCNFVTNNKLQHFFLDMLFIKIIQLNIAHGKIIVVNVILQMFCNYNMNGMVTKKEIDQKIIPKVPLNFHQY